MVLNYEHCCNAALLNRNKNVVYFSYDLKGHAGDDTLGSPFYLLLSTTITVTLFVYLSFFSLCRGFARAFNYVTSSCVFLSLPWVMNAIFVLCALVLSDRTYDWTRNNPSFFSALPLLIWEKESAPAPRRLLHRNMRITECISLHPINFLFSIFAFERPFSLITRMSFVIQCREKKKWIVKFTIKTVRY